MYVRWFIHISCMIIYSDDSVCKMIYSHIMTRLTHVCEMIYIHIVHDDLFRWFNMWDDLFTYHAVISCMIWLTMVCEMTHLTEPVCPLTNFFCRGMTLLYKGMGLLCRDTELLRGDIWLFCREIGLFSRQLLAARRVDARSHGGHLVKSKSFCRWNVPETHSLVLLHAYVWHDSFAAKRRSHALIRVPWRHALTYSYVWRIVWHMTHSLIHMCDMARTHSCVWHCGINDSKEKHSHVGRTSAEKSAIDAFLGGNHVIRVNASYHITSQIWMIPFTCINASWHMYKESYQMYLWGMPYYMNESCHSILM